MAWNPERVAVSVGHATGTPACVHETPCRTGVTELLGLGATADVASGKAANAATTSVASSAPARRPLLRLFSIIPPNSVSRPWADVLDSIRDSDVSQWEKLNSRPSFDVRRARTDAASAAEAQAGASGTRRRGHRRGGGTRTGTRRRAGEHERRGGGGRRRACDALPLLPEQAGSARRARACRGRRGGQPAGLGENRGGRRQGGNHAGRPSADRGRRPVHSRGPGASSAGSGAVRAARPGPASTTVRARAAGRGDPRRHSELLAHRRARRARRQRALV